MRIYEYSKKNNLSNKELVDLLKKQGFDVASHMSVLPDDAIAFLDAHYAPKPTHITPPTQQKEKNVSTMQEKPKVVEAVTKPIINSAHNEQAVPSSQTSEVFVLAPMTVSQFAQKIKKPVNDVMLTLLKQGVVSSKNQLLTLKVVEQLARHYQIAVTHETAKKEEQAHYTPEEKVLLDAEHQRLPIVVVVGHVDHGKTTLLDFIRNTRVAAREHGGITQHLGAYEVKTPHGGIVFLDTPGHAAFIKMRARGVKVADIAILVVGADDGVMPQTVEAIKHTKNLKVPIIVAINKIDKASPVQIETVKRQLTQYDLLPEEWGGQTICVPISAKTGVGIDQLLEMVQLQSDVMELRADAAKPGKGFVLEARMEKGRGAVATVIAQEGTIKVSDYFRVGSTFGKVNSLVDSSGKNLKSVGPSIPVLVAGFDLLPEAGDLFEVVTQDQYQKAKSSSRDIVKEEPKHLLAEGAINLMIKADTKSSSEALVQSIDHLGEKSTKKFQIVSTGIGDISESDVELAHTTHSIIYGFNVKFELKAAALAQKLDVQIRSFQIIYKMLDDIELLAKENEPIKYVSTKIGEAVVRKIFEIKNLGTIAGCYVKEGRLSRNGHVVIMRGKNKVGEGSIKSLERDKKSVKEVHAGFECAFLVDGFNEWKIDDRVECVIEQAVKGNN